MSKLIRIRSSFWTYYILGNACKRGTIWAKFRLWEIIQNKGTGFFNTYIATGWKGTRKVGWGGEE